MKDSTALFIVANVYLATLMPPVAAIIVTVGIAGWMLYKAHKGE